MTSQSAFAERPSGILVPSNTFEKQQYTIPESDFKKLRRLMTFAREYAMRAMFFCDTCQQPVELKQVDRLVTEIGPAEKKTNAPGGRFELSCGCSQWAIR